MTNTFHVFYVSSAQTHQVLLWDVVGMIMGTAQLEVMSTAENLIFGGYSTRGCPSSQRQSRQV